MLILISEASQIFVWRNKVFIFFQKSDIDSLEGSKSAMVTTTPGLILFKKRIT
jgi:hypothetical protein